MTRDKARALAKALVGKMTLDEKASQLTYHAAAIPRLNVPAYNWWNEALHGRGARGYGHGVPPGRRHGRGV